MRKTKYLTVMVIAMVLICSLSANVFAHDVPNMSMRGSITVKMQYQGKAVPGGNLTIYQVGDVAEDDGNYSFALSKDFASSGVTLDDLESPKLADNFANYAKTKGVKGTTKSIDSEGKVVFDKLAPALYLAVQNKPAKGYSKASAFLITLPMIDDNGNYIYNVDASPKVEIEKSTTPPSPPHNPPRLPQTGQLNWPIPVMAAAGLLLFSIGWLLRSRKENADYEK